MISLPSLRLGARGVLARIGATNGQRRRLLEMGLVPGTEIRLIRRAKIGDVLEVEVRGYRVALRVSEAADLMVEPV